MIVYSYMELCSFKAVKLDVCGSLVLSNPVTHTVHASYIHKTDTTNNDSLHQYRDLLY